MSVVWFLSMAMAGFFTPYFTDNIPFFKVKALHLQGLETIPPEVVAQEVSKLKNNWLFISEGVLLKNLNQATGNAVSSLDLSRSFRKGGVELIVSLQERRPFFSLVKDGELLFFDERGVPFSSPYLQAVEPLIYAHDTELVKQNFHKIKSLLDTMGREVEEIYLTEISTVVYTKDRVKIVLPPPILLQEELLRKIAKLRKNYNLVLNVKEMEVSTEGLIIVRHGEAE